ncbi:PH domain-containing protein [Polaribacter sargassicola]|uniref:PH domain-containing protein n=1 Tax=Polaribacter sargassicola TaxID=2836891 RepID=UPI001F3E9018|nr:PH domain-containing protein [Polaribacter sp. DS7-9]MCG1035447.1 PH domain-containing protein [Polaribacter sp. DS7-9]
MFANEIVSSFPDITEVTFKSINKKYLKVILINILLFFSVVLIGLFLADYFSFFNKISSYTYLIYMVFTLVFIITCFITYVGFKKRKYAIREKDVSYKSGIFFKKITTVPFSRIQHIEVDEGPVSRFFKLASLSVFTAGDSSDDLEIKGITKIEALEIKEFITKKINE